MRRIFYIIPGLLLALPAFSQQADLYIAPDVPLFFFRQHEAAVFGNVRVAGEMGQETGNTVHFFGQQWQQDTSAFFPDETAGRQTAGRGGRVAFRQPHPIHGHLGVQTISGGYQLLDKHGPALPSVSVQNRSGVVLMSQDASVRNNLTLDTGNVYLNGYNLAIGTSQDAGNISGYTEDKFIVTGAGITGGTLARLSVPSGPDTVVFPIGTDDGAYSPAAIVNNGMTDDFRARVFDGVLERGTSGADVSDRTNGKTWMIAAAGSSFRARVMLQHQKLTEGSLYQQYRDQSYLSRLAGSQWDSSGVYGPPTEPAWITSGASVSGSAMSGRIFALGGGVQTNYFTSLTPNSSDNPNTCSAQFTYFHVWKENPFKARLSWGVLARPGVVSFEIEKKISLSAAWRTVATIPATNGFDYTWEDNDIYYDQAIAYRIRLNCKNGEHLYSDTKILHPERDAVVYPNPTKGRFTVAVTDPKRSKAIVVYDAAGNTVVTRAIKQQYTEFDLQDMAVGIYFVSIISESDARMQTIKILKEN